MATEYGSRLRLARKNARLTQAGLSKKTGIPQSTISTAEREGHGSGETPVYAQACGVNVMWLAKGDGEMLNFDTNKLLAVESIASGAININVNRQAPTSAHDVATALMSLISRVEPGRRDAVASLLSSLARNPSDSLLTEMLVQILEPATFTQPDQRTG